MNNSLKVCFRLIISCSLDSSGEASPTFGHANFSVFIDRIRNQFLKK